ncbi:hypothetical protein ACFOET_03660 [Parapedobacter deserti]|uniref:Uncharacterized protein n=1 Tax=Parapedobacter deserti TaxID=1912957 RepID=A0ABV7JHX7_9SPHI
MNALGYLRVMFAVDNIDDMVSRLSKVCRWSVKWFSTKTLTGSVTSVGPKGFLSALLNKFTSTVTGYPARP